MKANVRFSLLAVMALVVAAALALPAVGDNDSEAYRQAHAANVDIDVSQRIFPVGEKAEIRAWLYNTKRADFRAYKVPLEKLAPNAFAVYESDEDEEGSLPYRLKHLDLGVIAPAAP